MSVSSYAIALEAYVKWFVSEKSVATARERGTYDKTIMRFVIDFTYKTSPKKRWGVSKAELIEDMTAFVDQFGDFNAIKLEGRAFCYRNKSGELRVIYGDYADEIRYELRQLPEFALDDLAPDMDFGFIDVKVKGDSVILPDGETLPFDNHILDTIINVTDRLVTVNNQL